MISEQCVIGYVKHLLVVVSVHSDVVVFVTDDVSVLVSGGSDGHGDEEGEDNELKQKTILNTNLK